MELKQKRLYTEEEYEKFDSDGLAECVNGEIFAILSVVF